MAREAPPERNQAPTHRKALLRAGHGPTRTGARLGPARGGPSRARRGEPPPYAAELLAARDEERRRIARELHDGTAATLVALSLDLTRLVERLSPGEARELASACAVLCEQSLRELRAAAFVLHPPLLERGGLLVALQWLVEGFSKRSGIVVTLEPGDRAGERFRPSVELALYRIAQEALTNVLRHSGSRTARVVLVAGTAEVRLTVSDEGTARRGRDPVDREGVGLASMRARVRSLGGRLDLTSRPVGTVLAAVVPRSRPRRLRGG